MGKYPEAVTGDVIYPVHRKEDTSSGIFAHSLYKKDGTGKTLLASCRTRWEDPV